MNEGTIINCILCVAYKFFVTLLTYIYFVNLFHWSLKCKRCLRICDQWKTPQRVMSEMSENGKLEFDVKTTFIFCEKGESRFQV